MEKDVIKAEILDVLKSSPIIYKYLGDSKVVLKILQELKLQFSSPSKFNDPFDCYEELITFEKVSDDDVQRLDEKYKNQFPEAIDKIKIALKNLNFGEISEAYKTKSFPILISTIGISCFSRNYKHNLMWSHYANSHSGVCLGFDLIKLYNTIEKIPNSNKALLKINYKSEFESKDFFQDGSDSILHLLKTKSNYWEYEDEVRLVYTKLKLDDQGKKMIKIGHSCINQIIFGVNFSINKNFELLDFIKLNFPKIDLYQMQPVKNSYEIEKVKFE